MPRATRAHTVARHLTNGGFVRIELAEEQQKAGPDIHQPEGFAVRNYVDTTQTLLTVVGAYGPDWFMTLAQIRYRLEQPYVRCTVTDDAPGLRDHELLVRWATSTELQDRKAAMAARQAPLVRLLRDQEAKARAAAERQALEDAGQSGLF
ncbi:hypothetical protein [Streptomyces sp. NPDC046685]|uniref:hypothetical protein n=1 Tax=Streptomyces sp. NPDC046685 TaxID=3157202 RepID=UPI0034083D5D